MNMSDLLNRDYYLLIDKSGSMVEADCGGKTRWKACQESTIAVANKIAEFDPDGITVIPFASTFKTYANVTPSTVKTIFEENEPMGGTQMAAPMQSVFDEFIVQKKKGSLKANGSLMIVVTDGLPTDADDVAACIAKFTKHLDDRKEFGISFLQIGKDGAASAYLKRLDNDLQGKGAKHDIVNTKTFDELEKVGLTEALFAALSE